MKNTHFLSVSPVKRLFFSIVFFLSLQGIIFTSCKKGTDKEEPKPVITLEEPILEGESIALNWRLDNPSDDIIGYEIYRGVDDFSNNNYYFFLTSLNGKNTHQFKDILIPYVGKVSYLVRARFSDKSKAASSNSVTVSRDIPSFILNGYQSDINLNLSQFKFDKQSGVLIIRDSYSPHKIISYDLNTQTQTSIEPQSGVSISSTFGTYNGIRELYILCNDNRIYIYNAKTLEYINNMPWTIMGNTVSMAYSNGNIYMAGGIEVGVINRATFHSYTFPNVHLYAIKSPSDTSTYFTGINYYERKYSLYTNNGELVNEGILDFLDPYVTTSFGYEYINTPRSFIYGDKGSIIELKTNNTISSINLPRGSYLFNNYYVDESTSSMYASSEHSNTTPYSNNAVVVYSLPDYTERKVIRAKGAPQLAFPYNGFLYVLEKPLSSIKTLALEKIPL
jgi:hypothetical protein